MNTIVFRIGEETSHRIELIDKKIMESSLFSDQYKKTLSVLNERFSFMEHVSDESNEVPFTDDANPLNNIISFIGDRGSGKTSCMMSIAKLLERGIKDPLKEPYPALGRRSFYCIDMIDPAFFDENHNVIELFIANLLRAYQDDKKESRCREKEKKDSELLSKFVSAQKTMSEMIERPTSSFDELENLQRLSAGIRLGENIRLLVDAFLEYQGLTNGVLVIPIDDIDLNSNMAAEMLEQIRKYLIHPNIIILMSVKLDQLALTKRLRIQKDYGSLTSVLVKDLSGIGVFDEMVDAYLTKTLPHNQRIYMPDGSSYFERKVTIISREGNVIESFDTVRQMVLELIYRKTRYLFYNYESRTSFIVPDNLRQLRHLVGLLYSMKDYWQGDNQIHNEGNKYNKLLFRKYLFENWTFDNLTIEMQNAVKELLRVQDASQINATVLSVLRMIFKDSLENVYDTEISYILEPLNKKYNIALGDVLDIMDKLEDSETDIVKLRFLFLLRSYYSIMLYRTHEMLTQASSGHDVVAINKMSEMNLSEYEALVAGYFINTRISFIVPTGYSAKVTRSHRMIIFSDILALIEDVLANKENVNVDKLRLLEFLLLSISRRYDTKDSNIQNEYRKEDPVFYAESLQLLQKNAFFDVGALMFNLSRMEECYNRFRRGNEIYELAEQTEGSLLNSFRIRSLRKEKKTDNVDLKDYRDNYWLYWSCFRNAEIIRAFKSRMLLMKSPGGSHASVLAKAFRQMSSFKINTYDKTEDGKYHEVDFSFFQEISSLLETESVQEIFKELFDNYDERIVYAPEYLDFDMLLRGAKLVNNRAATRIRRIYDNYEMISKHYRFIVDNVFASYGQYLTKDELHSALTLIDEQLNQYRY